MTLRVPLPKNELDRLVEQIEPLKKGFDLLNDHVIIADENANILYANKAVETNTGFPVSEVIGKNPADLWGGNMPKEFYEKMWQIIKIEKRPFVGEVQNKKKNGVMYFQELHISPILNEQNEVEFFIGIEPNITDRKEKEKFKEEFISIIGHQLRNPLASISWMLELLLKNGGLGEGNKNKLEEIYKESHSLINFVGDLLILSRLGGSGLSKEAFNPEAEIEKIITEVKIHNPKVDFVFNKKAPHVNLTVNKPLAIQVFSNLIYNAAEYSNQEAGKVSVTVEKNNLEYLFSCHNNGAEILEEDKPKIFTKLFRSNLAKEIKVSGAGLGLYIVKTIGDSFGWEVSFESNSGKGTTFYVKIPLK